MGVLIVSLVVSSEFKPFRVLTGTLIFRVLLQMVDLLSPNRSLLCIALGKKGQESKKKIKMFLRFQGKYRKRATPAVEGGRDNRTDNRRELPSVQAGAGLHMYPGEPSNFTRSKQLRRSPPSPSSHVVTILIYLHSTCCSCLQGHPGG